LVQINYDSTPQKLENSGSIFSELASEFGKYLNVFYTFPWLTLIPALCSLVGYFGQLLFLLLTLTFNKAAILLIRIIFISYSQT